MPNRTEAIDGLALRVFRVSREIRQCEVAAAYGVSPERIRAIEDSRRPTPAAVGRYLAALDAVEAERRS